MAFDIENFSSKELAVLIKQANKRRTELNKRKSPTEVRRKLEAAAKAQGYTIAELFGSGKIASSKINGPSKSSRAGRKLGKVAPKYRNPGNKAETWSGRGLPPRWMSLLLKKGKKREDFLIKR